MTLEPNETRRVRIRARDRRNDRRWGRRPTRSSDTLWRNRHS